jgi:hypothetical protein
MKCDYYHHHVASGGGTCPRDAQRQVKEQATTLHLCDYHLREWLFDTVRAHKVGKWFGIQNIVAEDLRCHVGARRGQPSKCKRKYLAANFEFDEPAPASYRTEDGRILCRYHAYMDLLAQLRTEKQLQFAFGFKELSAT